MRRYGRRRLRGENGSGGYSRGFDMRARRLVGLSLTGLGLVLIAAALSAGILHYALPIGIGWLAVC
jgi:hypothetical protein